MFVSLPEEAVVFYADLPQPFSRAMILEFESHGALKLFRLLTKETCLLHRPTHTHLLC